MQRKGNACTLLVGMSINTAPAENNRAVAQKKKKKKQQQQQKKN